MILDKKMLHGMMEWEYEANIQAIEDAIRRGIWTQRDGTEIHVRDMTRNHILNTIAMLQRNGGFRSDSWIRRFEEELEDREYIRKCANDNW